MMSLIETPIITGIPFFLKVLCLVSISMLYTYFFTDCAQSSFPFFLKAFEINGYKITYPTKSNQICKLLDRIAFNRKSWGCGKFTRLVGCIYYYLFLAMKPVFPFCLV